MRKFLLLICVAWAATPRSAGAEMITWQFTGRIDAVAGGATSGYAGEIASLFPVGSLVTYELTLDPAWAPDRVSDFSSQYRFDPGDPLNYSATVAGHDFTRSLTSGVVFANIGDGYVNVDTTLSELSVTSTPVAGTSTLWYGKGLDVHAVVPSGGGYTLPTGFANPLIADFALYLQAGRPSCFGCGTDGRVVGHFESVARVPEPGTLAVLGIGLLLAAAHLKRHRRR